MTVPVLARMKGRRRCYCIAAISSILLVLFQVLWYLWIAFDYPLVAFGTTKDLERTNQISSTSSSSDSKQWHQQAQDMIRIAKLAEAQGMGNCGSGNNVTSIRNTVARMTDNKIDIAVIQDNSIFVTLQWTIQAVDISNRTRTYGGDEFITTISGWSIPTTNDTRTLAFKTSDRFRDELDGTYVAEVRIPSIPLHRIQLDLVHYYTCWEGFLDVETIRDHHSVDQLGPLEVPISLTRVNSGSRRSTTTGQWLGLYKKTVPACIASQKGMDDMTRGVWVDLQEDSQEDAAASQNMSVKTADWYPHACQINGGLSEPSQQQNQIRIGDSTMPGHAPEVGNVYSHKKMYDGFRKRWVSVLHSGFNTSTSQDVLALTAGLHQLLNAGFHSHAATDIFLRMMCQLAVKFPGKFVLQGPVPVQQQLFHKQDMTDQRVQLVNALLRHRIRASEGRLDKICRNIPIELFNAHADANGAILPPNETQAAFEKLRTNLNVSFEELELREEFARLQAKDYAGNRTVWFLSLENFLRPRPECYRENDKIHDVRAFPTGGMLFFGKHAEFVGTYMNHRASSEDP